MVKKILVLNIFVVIIINTIFITSSASNNYDIHSIIGDDTDCIVENGITYIFDDFLNYAEIIDINLSDSEITIPEQIEHNNRIYPVKYITLERDYFKGFTSIKSKNTCVKLILPRSLEYAENFKNWSKLKEIYMPENSNIESIGPIYNCLNLEKLNIAKNVRYVPNIKNCPKLKLSISKNNKSFKLIKNNIYSKNGNALCKVVTTETKFIVTKKVLRVYENAFEGCKKLAKVTIKNTKKSPKIYKRAFKNTKKGIKFCVKNKKVAKSLKKQLKGSGVRDAKILIGKKVVYKNING